MVTQSGEECGEYCCEFVALDDHQGLPFLLKKGEATPLSTSISYRC